MLFVAVGCSADVRSSVTYAIDYAHATCGGATSTPRSLSTSSVAGEHEVAPAHPLGLLRVQNGYVVSAPRWIQPSEEGVEIGALATGRATSPTSATTSRPAMPISGATILAHGLSRTCRPRTAPWW